MDELNIELINIFIEKYSKISKYVPWLNILPGTDGILELLIEKDVQNEITVLVLGSIHRHVLNGQCECPDYLNEVKEALLCNDINTIQAIFIEHYIIYYDDEINMNSMNSLDDILESYKIKDVEFNEIDNINRLMKILAKLYGHILTLPNENYNHTKILNLKHEVSEIMINILINCEHSLIKYAAACNLVYFGEVIPSISYTSQFTSNHRLYPKTREWLFRRFEEHLNSSRICMLAIKSKPGFGISCFLTAICKQYKYQVITKYFLSESSININSIIQSMAVDIARSNAPYLNYIDDNISDIKQQHWKKNLEELIFTPLNALFTSISSEPESVEPIIQCTKDNRTSFQKCYGGDAVANIISGGNNEIQEVNSPRKGRAGHVDRKSDVANLLLDPVHNCDTNNNNNNKIVNNQDEMYIIVLDFSNINNSDISEVNDLLSNLVRNLPPQFKIIIGINQEESHDILKDIEHESITSKDNSEFQINDIEIYIANTLSSIISTQCKNSGCIDEFILQQCLEDLIIATAGRFDYAKELMRSFYDIMCNNTSQILSSQKRAIQELGTKHKEHDLEMSDFYGLFRCFRDKRGLRVNIKMNSSCLLDKLILLFI